jgi:hypothetical protein
MNLMILEMSSSQLTFIFFVKLLEITIPPGLFGFSFSPACGLSRRGNANQHVPRHVGQGVADQAATPRHGYPDLVGHVTF